MQCYTDIEVRAITAHRMPSVRLESSIHLKESAVVSSVQEPAMDEFFLPVHIEMPEMIQLIADLEFESNFAALLRSIALRWPAF